ncbi:metal ABC transporter ATP-binding protein [Pseudoclavibacter helvolus]|uniref:metal ABC transporter ATP-binding protein n=1 Tax=Pseudoclavibacter helvolus TaxID=255205 RepID=UPI0009EC256B|nr:ABC transporter ATP-binding protein [Pseudoclavibacter helvolus]
MTHPGPLVSYRDASIAYGREAPALTGVSFEVGEGDAIALLGPNGAGKSTLLQSLLGLLPTSGTAEVLGVTPGARASEVGYLPQSTHIDPDFPVSLRQVVMMGRYRRMGLFRWPSAADREVVRRAIETVGLTELANTNFGELSGGQRQRGLLARALATEPKLILLDEPFNGLDRTNRDALIATLRRLRETGVGIVVSTHDLELAHEVCSHVLLLNGRQIAGGPISEALTDAALAAAFSGTSADTEAHGGAHGTLCAPGGDDAEEHERARV